MCRASPGAVAGGALDTGQADLAESFYGPTPADPVREGVRAGRGDLVAVADVEGGRPGILWAVADADPGRRLSAGHRPGTGASGLVPAAREDFRDQHGDPRLRWTADPLTAPRSHDLRAGGRGAPAGPQRPASAGAQIN